jgi:hypothetical protein
MSLVTKRWLSEQLAQEETPEMNDDYLAGETDEMGGEDYTGPSDINMDESPENDDIAGQTDLMAGNAQIGESNEYEQEENPEMDDYYLQGSMSQVDDYIGDI